MDNTLPSLIVRLDQVKRLLDSNNRTSLALAQECLKDSRADGNPEVLAYNYFLLGESWSQSGESAKALRHLSQALRHIRQVKSPELHCKILYSLGSAYSMLHDLSQSQKYFMALKQRLDRMDSRFDSLRIKTLSGMASTFFRHAQYEKALKYYQSAIALSGNTDDINFAKLLSNLGSVYCCLQQYDKGIQQINKALKIHEQLGQQEHSLYTIHSLALSQLMADRPQEASLTAERGIKMSDKSQNLMARAICRKVAGEASLALRDYDRALFFLTEALPLIRECGNERYLMNTYKALATAHAGLHNWQTAYDFAIKHTDLRDTIRERELAPRLAQMEARFEQQMQHEKRDHLQKELHLREVELRQMAQDLSQHRQQVIANRRACLKTFRERSTDAEFEIWLDSTEQNSAEDLQQIESHFSRIHKGFLKTLSREFPNLTRGQLQQCSLLRSGLSTRDAATIIGQSEESFKKARQRLRKALGLGKDQRLTSFLLTL